MKKIIVASCLLLVAGWIKAQQFGGNPPSIKWKQIDTDTARIIFPAGMDSVAERVSNIVHYLAKNNPAKLGEQLRKVNIVLESQTTIANGYVSLAPFRSEFQVTPVTSNFEMGSISWPDALAVHEYRHVQQFNNFRNGLSNVFYYLFGESGWLVGINASVPDWFYEGDAVYNETITTNQGRGRIPFFVNQYKSLWLYNKDYSWMKLRNGSLKDYVPNHYPLGYLLVNYGREKYGLDFWSKVTKDASAFNGLFYPFQHAIKKYSGESYKKFTREASEYYKKLSGVGADERIATQQAMNRIPGAGIQNLTTLNQKFVTNYFYPFQLGGDSILYLKNSYRERPAFYIRNGRGEHKLRVKDISLDENYSYRNGKIVYAAYETDPRWSWRDYSVIRILDVHSGEQRSLQHRTKYFEPDISPDGKIIAAVQILPGGKSELHILNVADGSIHQKIHSAEINLFTSPKFIDDSLLVSAVRLNDGRMTIAIADINTGVLERLIVPGYGVIGNLNVNKGTVYFTASYSGNDEIYALRLGDRKVFQLTKTLLGNYFVNAQNQKIVWSGFTADGYQLREMTINSQNWIPLNDSILSSVNVLYPVAHSNQLHDILLNDVPNKKFPIKNYKQGGHLFYFHSWRPYFEDPDFTYSIYSDNILNTLSSEFYYHYNRNDKTSGVGVNFLYGGFYPFVNGGFEYTFNKPVSVGTKPAHLDELETSIGLSIPLEFTSGRSFRNFLIGTNYVFDKRMLKGSLKDSVGNIDYSYLHHYISWSHYIQRALQHIYPLLGYSFSFNDRHAITNYNSYQLIGNAAIYLPGFFSTHSIVFTGSYQQRDSLNILFSDHFENARGYSSYYNTRFGRSMLRLSANYHFPIFYPDWGFANLVYIQRVRGNLFYDFARMSSRRQNETLDLKSAGGEMYFDTKWWNEFPLTFGVRLSHLLTNGLRSGDVAGNNWFEVLIPIVIPQ